MNNERIVDISEKTKTECQRNRNRAGWRNANKNWSQYPQTGKSSIHEGNIKKKWNDWNLSNGTP